MPKILNIIGREILDSRGNPTIEVELKTETFSATAAVPSGASTGIYEAVELRDSDPKRYGGKGVLTAVDNVNTIIREAFLNQDIETLNQKFIDEKMIALDGTANKGNLGANAILGFSLAFAKAKAHTLNMSLHQYFKSLLPKNTSPLKTPKYIMPVPMMNILNGGKHADSGLDIQEFLIIPVGAPTFREALRYGSEIFHALKKILSDKGLVTAVGDEGGFAPHLGSNEAGFQVIIEAIKKAGYIPGKDIFLAIDAAASSFYDKEKQTYTVDKKELSTEELKEYYINLRMKYPIISMEDPFDEDDWGGFKMLKDAISDTTQIMGDDLFVTNPERIATGIEKQSANSVLIKLNQIGTLTETIEAVSMSMNNKWTAIVSHRSGETEDSTIADLSVGLGTGQIKTGSLSRTDRMCKYNQLIRIEEKEGSNAIYPGMNAFYNIAKK